jgi:hypothetical protein
MNIRKIISEWLVANGFDGLFNADYECACQLDDLFPCGCDGVQDCQPGYKGTCGDKPCADCDEGLFALGSFCITAIKPVKPEEGEGGRSSRGRRER